MIDFLLMHKDWEANTRRYPTVPELIRLGLGFTRKFAFATEKLGYMLGSELYDAYLAGRLSKRYIRSLFFRKLNGSAARRYLSPDRPQGASLLAGYSARLGSRRKTLQQFASSGSVPLRLVLPSRLPHPD